MQMKPVRSHEGGACQFPCSHSNSSPWGHFLNPGGSYNLVGDSEACGDVGPSCSIPIHPPPTPNLLLSLSLSHTHTGMHMAHAPEDRHLSTFARFSQLASFLL